MKAPVISMITAALSWGLFFGINSSALTKTHAAKTPQKKPTVSVGGFTQRDINFTKVLQKAVVMDGSASTVRYRWLMNHQDKHFLLYLRDLQFVAPRTYDTWTSKQKEAFLINAYNAFTLKLVVDNYLNSKNQPIKSVKQIGGTFLSIPIHSPWKMHFISLLWKKMSLNDIEQMLTQFNDPRIHFAINSATIGSPELRNEAYIASRLDNQLNEQARLFLRDSVRNQINVAKKTLKLSKIFDWYKADFTKKAGSVEKFIAPYITGNAKVQKELVKNKFTISYTTYDWNLNDAK